ncbi:MAG TPA: carboxypeptidase regulatory-like domain-containing protein [Candidatus Acidoferrum sp.]|nr:carboxypeptidase regulatory-like domain-containing protein [Candidatus Acidoferrum sp.]
MSGLAWWPGSLFFLFALLLAFAPLPLLAQQYSGTITGTVTDPSGAAVAGATVLVINTGTNASYPAVTTDLGVYTVAQLPVGYYEVHVKQGNFKEFVAKGVEVHTSSVTQVNAELALGAATETVTVEASDVQVQTASASVGNVVEGQQVRELPLNGENFMGLVTLAPGVSPANDFDARDKGLTGGSDFSVNGNPYTNNLFLVDGVNNNDVGSNRTILIYPATDSIAEFKMLTNSYGPEYGQATGAIISITTRSGENTWHGGAFYAGRNDKLDANDWFSNNNGTGKAELRRNDWGYFVAGPVIKNKLFFWWNQEWNREVRGVSVGACVPTVAEQAGDFSQGFSGAAPPPAGATSTASQGTVATDQCGALQPAQWVGPTGGPFTYQSLIPVADQASGNPFAIANPDANAQLLASFYPAPTTGNGGLTLINGQNWLDQERTQPNWSEWNVRGDYDVTKGNRVTLRWTQDSWTSPAPNPNLFWGDSIFPTINSDWSQPSKSVMAKLTSQIGTSMVNDVEFGYGHNAIITTLTSGGAPIVAQINANIPTAWPTSLKSLPAYPQVGWGGLSPYGNGQNMWTIAPYGNHEDLYAFQDNLSKVQGNHLFKFGAYYSTNAKIENNNGGSDQPLFVAADYAVGTQMHNQLANLLLPGQTFNTSENSVNPTARVIWHDFEWYVGDTWKFRKNLTLTYGIRWSFYREPFGEDNHWASFSLADYNASLPASDACNGVIIVPGTTPCQDAATQLASLGISLPLSDGTPGPNRALVNQNNHDIAPRLGLAWDVRGDGKTAVRLGIGQFFQRELVGIDESLARTAPFEINANDNGRTLEAAVPLVSPSVSPNAAKDPRGVTPNSWQWNLSVERELWRNTALQVGYVGNTGIHLTSMLDLNAVPSTDWNQTAFLSTSSYTNVNTFRPAGNFGSIGEFARMGHATYHSLQVQFRTKLSNFSQFQVSYTYSHSIGDVELDNSSGSVNQEAVTDQSNPGLDKGNTNINRPNIFVANEVFYLPKLANKSMAMRQALGGWELNSIITITSGASLSVFSNGASDINACVSPEPIPGATVVPCATSGNGYYQLNSLQGSGFGNNQRPDITGTSCNAGESGKQILNPAAFTFVGYTLGTVGNAPRGYCFGPDYRNFDMQLAKNWTFKERYNVKFSMDFFNLFNHANFFGNNLEGVGFSANNLQCGTTACSPINNVVTGQAPGQQNGFGQASAVHPGRELQYTLRFTF